MIIGVDCNGPLGDFLRLKACYVEDQFGIKCCPQMFKRDVIESRGVLTPDQYNKMQDAVYGPEYGYRMKPVSGVVETLRALLEQGHEIYVITSRTGEHLEVAQQWWMQVSNNLPVEFVGTGRGQSKGPMVKRLGLDLFIDDDPGKLIEISREGAKAKLMLFSGCFNSAYDLPDDIARLPSWRHFEERIHSGNLLRGTSSL